MNEECIIPNCPQNSAELYTALVQAQAVLKNPQKNQSGYGYKYSGLDQITTIIRETLPKFGLTPIQLLQDANLEDGKDAICIETFLIHSSGQRTQSSFFTLPVSLSRNLTIEQSYGKTITYASRYALNAFFLLAGEEDTDASNGETIDQQHKREREEELQVIADCTEKIKKLQIEDWCTGEKKYSPATASLKKNKAFLNQNSEKLLKDAEAWRAK